MIATIVCRWSFWAHQVINTTQGCSVILTMCFPMDRPEARIRCCPQVEFGAHQVILIRSTDNFDTLPELLKDSNALTMTVPQSKVRFPPPSPPPLFIISIDYAVQSWRISRGCPPEQGEPLNSLGGTLVGRSVMTVDTESRAHMHAGRSCGDVAAALGVLMCLHHLQLHS